MKTNLFTRNHFTAALVAVALFLGGCKDSALEEEMLSAVNVEDAKVGGNTAQSIMINSTAIPGSLATDEAASYSFSQREAKTYYSVSPDGGQGQQALNDAVETDKCIFFNGGTLRPYTFTKSTGGKTPTITLYTVTPKGTGEVNALTAWEESKTGTNAALISLDGLEIAAQSVVNNAKQGGKKYSFSIENRIALEVKVVDADDPKEKTVTDVQGNLASRILNSEDYIIDKGSAADAYLYSASTNLEFGETKLLSNIPSPDNTIGNIIRSGNWGKIVSDDNAQVLKARTISFNLPRGKYKLVVTGTIKGNSVDGTIDRPFSIERATAVEDIPCLPK